MTLATTTEVGCPLCREAALQPGLTLEDAAGLPTRIWQCRNCFCQVPDSALAADASVPDAVDYQMDPHEQVWSAASATELEGLRRDLRHMVGVLEPEFGPPGRSVIEIGCGRGGMLRALLDRGYDARGCEPSPRLVANARRYYDLDESRLLQLAAMPFLDHLEAQDLHADVIVMWHVLEHLHEPMRVLERCVGRLRPGGTLVLQLPLLSSDAMFREHFFFATPQTLPVLAKRLGGLDVRWSVDLDNQFLSAFLGPQAQRAAPMGSPLPGTGWEASAAMAEPIRQRDRALALRARVIADQQRALAELERVNEALRARLGEIEAILDDPQAERARAAAAREQQHAAHEAAVAQLRHELAARDRRIAELEKETLRQARRVEDGWAASQAVARELGDRLEQAQALHAGHAALAAALAAQQAHAQALERRCEAEERRSAAFARAAEETNARLAEFRARPLVRSLCRLGLFKAPTPLAPLPSPDS